MVILRLQAGLDSPPANGRSWPQAADSPTVAVRPWPAVASYKNRTLNCDNLLREGAL